jgi:hypothetical protein
MGGARGGPGACGRASRQRELTRRGAGLRSRRSGHSEPVFVDYNGRATSSTGRPASFQAAKPPATSAAPRRKVALERMARWQR